MPKRLMSKGKPCLLISLMKKWVHNQLIGATLPWLSFLTCIHVLYAQDEVDAKIIVAGLSTTCSQKIHNQLVCNMVFANVLSTEIIL